MTPKSSASVATKLGRLMSGVFRALLNPDLPMLLRDSQNIASVRCKCSSSRRNTVSALVRPTYLSTRQACVCQRSGMIVARLCKVNFYSREIIICRLHSLASDLPLRCNTLTRERLHFERRRKKEAKGKQQNNESKGQSKNLIKERREQR